MANKVFTYLEKRDDRQMELFLAACRALDVDGITIFTHPGVIEEGEFKWIEEMFGEEMWKLTWIGVVESSNVRQFMLDLDRIDKHLLTVGFGGSPAHKTSLLKRILIPMDGVQEIPIGLETYVPVESDAAGAVPKKKAAPKKVEVVLPADFAPSIDLDALGLTTDQRRFAELMLTGKIMRIVANEMGVSWDTATRQLNPAVAEKFKVVGYDFSAMVFAVRKAKMLDKEVAEV